MSSNGNGKAKGGRPRIEFTDEQWHTIINLAAIQCTAEEVAAVLEISPDTLHRRIKETHDTSTLEFLASHSHGGKVSLRRAQFKLAEEGNPTMQIWLGKQYLNQKDRSYHDHDHTAVIALEARVSHEVIRYDEPARLAGVAGILQDVGALPEQAGPSSSGEGPETEAH